MLRCLACDQPVRSYPVVRRSCPDNFRGSGVPPQRCGHVWLGSGSRLARFGCPHLANASNAPPCPCLLPGHGPPSARDGRPACAARFTSRAVRLPGLPRHGGWRTRRGLSRSDHRARSDTWPLSALQQRVTCATRDSSFERKGGTASGSAVCLGSRRASVMREVKPSAGALRPSGFRVLNVSRAHYGFEPKRPPRSTSDESPHP